MPSLRSITFGFVVGALGIWPSLAQAQSIDRYGLLQTLTLPGSGGPVAAAPDGRLVTLSGSTVYRETSAGSRTFSALGTLSGADFSASGAAFVRVSPDGTKLAVGNGGGASFSSYKVGVFTLPALSGVWFSVNHFDGAWCNNRFLALSAGTFGQPSAVIALDTAITSSSSPRTITLVNNIGGSSGGIAFDAARNLFTGNGYKGAGPSETGAIHGFPRAQWRSVLSGGAALDFETQGTEIAVLLSASPLQFDNGGNLLVGGGNFGVDNPIALVRASAVARALSGGEPVDPDDSSSVRRFDPDSGNSSNFYTVTTNPARAEFYVQDQGTPTKIFMYGACSASRTPGAPLGPTSWVMLANGAVVLLRRARAE